MTAHGAATPTTERPHGAQHTAERFAAVYGTAPQGIWAAPGRVNLIGEHTDYNDGFVMPLALPHTTLAAAAPRTDGVLRLHSGGADGGIVELRLDELRPAPGAGWAAYPAGIVWAMREAGLPVGGADLHYDSTVPTGAGLSSSAALEVATALALNDLYGLGLERQRLAQLAQRAENAFVGVPCGIMDQTAAACCTEGHALFLDTRDLTRRQVPFDLAAEGLRLLVVDTRVQHELGDGAYAERRAGCESGARALGVRALRDVAAPHLPEALAKLADRPAVQALVRHIVTENDRVEQVVACLDAGRPRAIGPLLTAGHASLRDDFKISCRELDLAVDTANAAGALGARMTGGGFGGSAIVLVEETAARTVGTAVTEAFAAAGHAAPRIFEAVPSAGAHRLD
ncbi:galactokinase [Streptomyces lydicus]|uniref:galactokinase n=1 Tax=Streptomyces lydicus TaxID=47763 RepID=UPI000524268C|nr:galactokinase [Streptomyces lydicus]MDC7338591.1 galactokinase [Streptomyces lydicus]UEG91955.1 galactokinase [Streptomyces lydicus]